MRIRLVSLLLVATSAAQSFGIAADSSVISNTADLTSIPFSELPKLRSFDLTGTIIHVEAIDMTRNAVVLDDGHSGAFLEGATNPVNSGDILHAEGYATCSDYGERVYVITNAEKIGTASLPKPINAIASSLSSGTLDYKHVRLQATVHDIFVDELDSNYVYCILNSGNQFVYATCRVEKFPLSRIALLSGSEVEARGVFVPCSLGHRRFIGGMLRLSDVNAIRIVKKAVSDPNDLPDLDDVRHISPQRVRAMGRRRAHGTVLAAWNDNKLLLKTSDEQLHVITLEHGQPLPKSGNTVTVGGNAETDFYLINLDKAVSRIEDCPIKPGACGQIVRPTDILNRGGGKQINAEYYGRVVSIRGTVTTPKSVTYDSRYLYLDCKTHIIPINISTLDNLIPPELGSTVEATGVCIMDVDNWSLENPAPTIRGFSLVARTAKDINVIAKPPFWRPFRILMALAASLSLLLGFAIWTALLNHQVKRRSQQLHASRINEERAKIKSEERTHLAVELHDSLSQNLSGIACQLSATADALRLNPDILAENLATAQRMLDSSRTELKRCLFDLRSDALETDDFNQAIRMTLAPCLDQTDVTVKFFIRRAKLDESLAHATLCIIRELVANAIRHGRASEIRIAGSIDDDKLLFSVCDNGSGFDVNDRPGPTEGHFGIEGICERVERHGGTMDICSTPGTGTKIRITMSLPDRESQP